MRIHGQMYLGVEPPFVRPIAWFPPRAPVASGCTLTWLASIISHSKFVSSTRASRIFSQIPLSRHRQNQRCTFFQFPYASGKSRQGAPVRRIQNTPLINCRVSRAFPPRVPCSPMVYGLIFSHVLSLISCRCCSLAFLCPPSILRTIISHFYWRHHLAGLLSQEAIAKKNVRHIESDLCFSHKRCYFGQVPPIVRPKSLASGRTVLCQNWPRSGTGKNIITELNMLADQMKSDFFPFEGEQLSAVSIESILCYLDYQDYYSEKVLKTKNWWSYQRDVAIANSMRWADPVFIRIIPFAVISICSIEKRMQTGRLIVFCFMSWGTF